MEFGLKLQMPDQCSTKETVKRFITLYIFHHYISVTAVNLVNDVCRFVVKKSVAIFDFFLEQRSLKSLICASVSQFCQKCHEVLTFADPNEGCPQLIKTLFALFTLETSFTVQN